MVAHCLLNTNAGESRRVSVKKQKRVQIPTSWKTLIWHKFGHGNLPRNEVLADQVARQLGWPRPWNRSDSIDTLARYLDEFHPEWHLANTVKKAHQIKQQRGLIQKASPKPSGRLRDKTPDPTTDDFLLSYQWRRVRMKVLLERGPTCECCGANAQRDRVKINVDHIKTRKYYPELALDPSNLQVLCNPCNHGKGNWDQTNWKTRTLAEQAKLEPTRPRLVPKPTGTDAPKGHAAYAPFWDQYWKK